MVEYARLFAAGRAGAAAVGGDANSRADLSSSDAVTPPSYGRRDPRTSEFGAFYQLAPFEFRPGPALRAHRGRDR